MLEVQERELSFVPSVKPAVMEKAKIAMTCQHERGRMERERGGGGGGEYRRGWRGSAEGGGRTGRTGKAERRSNTCSFQ